MFLIKIILIGLSLVHKNRSPFFRVKSSNRRHPSCHITTTMGKRGQIWKCDPRRRFHFTSISRRVQKCYKMRKELEFGTFNTWYFYECKSFKVSISSTFHKLLFATLLYKLFFYTCILNLYFFGKNKKLCEPKL
jgi:hypothetical protein